MSEPNAIQISVTLDDIKPRIWRRLSVPISWDLEKLHFAIQAAFNWQNAHLHRFDVGDIFYGDKALLDREGEDERILNYRGVPLADFPPKTTFFYRYDFGDDWQHTVKIEKFLTLDFPVIDASCSAGARATPPEDVGGWMGYERFLEVMGDVDHPEHLLLKRWCGGHFDAAWFDIEAINADLKTALRPDVERRRHQPKPAVG